MLSSLIYLGVRYVSFSHNGPYTAPQVNGENLALQMAKELTRLKLNRPYLIRSDKGGSDGSSSRLLAESWGIMFVSCVEHTFHNIACDLLMYLENTTAKKIVYLCTYLFNGKLNSLRHARWVLAQKGTETIQLPGLAKLASRLQSHLQEGGMSDEAQLFAKYKTEMSEIAPAGAFAQCCNCANLVSVANSLQEEASNTRSEDSVKAQKMPLPVCTRHSHSCLAYGHVGERLRELYMFVASELMECSNEPCSSLQELIEILAATPLETLKQEFQNVCKNA